MTTSSTNSIYPLGDGKITGNFGEFSEVSSVNVQTDGRIIVVGTVNSDFAIIKYNSNGTLDTNFGDKGVVTTNFGNDDRGQSSIIQSDGKILVAGGSNAYGSYDFSLARYNANGSLDSNFSSDGMTTTNFGDFEWGLGVALQKDGKILIVGNAIEHNFYSFGLARYNANGSLDTSFGSNGLVTTDFGDRDFARSVAVQADGKILVAGKSYANGSFDFSVARYNTDGSLDSTFDDDGRVTTNIGAYQSSDQGECVVVQTDGKILIAGTSGSDFALVRYNTNGSLDTGFGSNGRAIIHFGRSDHGYSAAVQNDGKILIAGVSDNNFAIARCNADGSLDTSFGNGGLVTTDFGGNDKGHSVTIQADGKIIVAGKSEGNVAIARYNPDGSLDTSFYDGKGDDVVHGTNKDDAISGFAGNDTLYGHGGDDTLAGGDGNDVLQGGQGNDTLNGSAGSDTASYADSTAGVTVDVGLPGTQNTKGAGIDKLVAIENLTGSKYADTLTGDRLANVLLGGGANDTLNGKGGSDILDGGAGGDKMFGGAGNDTYYVGGTNDLVYETATSAISDTADLGGADTIISTISYTLGKFVENLTLAGTASASGTGNDLANTINGNDAANTLKGLSGNDTLKGGAGDDKLFGGEGKDTLTGDAGKDLFVLDTAPTSRDAITDFSHADGDRIVLSKAVFAGLAYTGTLHAEDFLAGAGATRAHDASDRIIYNTTSGVLYYDADGLGGTAAVQIAQLGASWHPELVYNDLQIIA